MQEDSAKDFLFKWADLVVSQSNDLWTISLPFLGICVLVVMHLHGNPSIARPKRLVLILWISAVCSALSLFLGYKLKGSVVTALNSALVNDKIVIPDTASYDGLFQFLLFLIGVFSFLVALGWKPAIVAKALINTVKGK